MCCSIAFQGWADSEHALAVRRRPTSGDPSQPVRAGAQLLRPLRPRSGQLHEVCGRRGRARSHDRPAAAKVALHWGKTVPIKRLNMTMKHVILRVGSMFGGLWRDGNWRRRPHRPQEEHAALPSQSPLWALDTTRNPQACAKLKAIRTVHCGKKYKIIFCSV